jgi:hypothetical protein
MTKEEIHQLMKLDGWIDELGYAIRGNWLYALGGLANEIEATMRKHGISFEPISDRIFKLTELTTSRANEG